MVNLTGSDRRNSRIFAIAASVMRFGCVGVECTDGGRGAIDDNGGRSRGEDGEAVSEKGEGEVGGGR